MTFSEVKVGRYKEVVLSFYKDLKHKRVAKVKFSHPKMMVEVRHNLCTGAETLVITWKPIEYDSAIGTFEVRLSDVYNFEGVTL